MESDHNMVLTRQIIHFKGHQLAACSWILFSFSEALKNVKLNAFFSPPTLIPVG